MRLIFWSILLLGMWIVLTGNLHMPNILVGVGISFSIALLYTKMFKHANFEFINPFWFSVYLWVLAKNLILSNLQITKRTLSPNMHLAPAIVCVKTNLKSKWKKLLLANSISLTPGTLTLDIKDDMLYIHIIECKDIEKKQEISREFEEVITKI